MKDEPIRVFLGWDHAESVAWHVFNHSIQRRASRPVSVTPIALTQLKEIFHRDWHPKQSNEFSFSRWLVPFLCDYKGWAIFADCDMLCRGDITDLWRMRDPYYAVQVVKHDHKPDNDVKYLDRPQSRYDKKNWSSVMLINCNRCHELTPNYVNVASGLELHQFRWLEDEGLIGEIPHEWNHLVGYDKYDPDAKIVHFTEGGPYFDEYRECDYSQEWFKEFEHTIHCAQRQIQPQLKVSER